MSQPVFCDTVQSLNDAVQSLSGCHLLFVDCEGVNLGNLDGTLSIITLNTPPSHGPSGSETYLVDVTRLSPTQLGPLFDILASHHITKVVWDGRMDYSALHHEYTVDMHNILDLQVVDILSRGMREETTEEHLKRFRGYALPKLLKGVKSRQRYTGLHKLSGLLQAIREHQPDDHEQFSKVKVDHSIWGSERPLPAEYIQYAAMDVHMISALYYTFVSRGYTTGHDDVALKAKCARYVAFWAERQPRVDERNFYVRNAFLPLELIDDPLPPHLPRRECGKCGRSLTDASYSPAQWAKQVTPTRACLLCEEVMKNFRHWNARENYMARRAAASQEKASL
ncbi:hypothetical protein BDW22DRAFT_1488252 [Trametopsis cervina]|nr:hypothetical protein BDW22DRAFT_1488252 [Trametopsis cervina]